MFKRGSRKAYKRLTRLLSGAALYCCFSALAAHAAPNEGELRAAVIVAIMRFTSWTNISPDETRLDVCLTGRPLAELSLLAVSGKQKVSSRALHVRQVWRDIKACQVLVMGSEVDTEFDQLLADAASQSTLTICDGCRRGLGEDAIIQLKLRQQRVSFEVNLEKAKNSGVTLDAQLLELAAVVRK